jgi:hypothetical protein
MDIKVLYVNSDGLYEEHSESADSIKVLSLKTANNELTDAKLGSLIGGGNASSEHIHDDRYYRENEHIAVSTGASDGSKPIITDASGKVDNTLIDTAGIAALIEHGNLAGLGDDDHAQYLLTSGARDVTGVMKYSTVVSISNEKDIVHKKYVDDLFSGQEWQDSAIDRIVTPPGTPATGDRYLIDATLGTATGDWAGQEDSIAEWDGTQWVFTLPTTGMFISVDDETDRLYLYDGSSWEPKIFESTTASTGLEKVGLDIRIASSAAGDGLGFSAGVLSVNVDNSSIEIDSDTLRVKALGIKDTMIDFGTGAGQVSGVDIPLADAGGYFGTDNVEAALQLLGEEVKNQGTKYTTGTGGVTKGDLVYIDSNNTVVTYATLSANEYAIGLALETKLATEEVKVLANDTIVTGVLSGAVAGTVYYWDGSDIVSTIPSGGGSNVWRVGVAKNATDLHVEVAYVKKNA